jgi:phospholipid/cholesterol/gamma-HCH transport system permease protein
MAPTDPPNVETALELDASGRAVLLLAGQLDSHTAGGVWRSVMDLTLPSRAGELVLDASRLEYCDGSGAGLIVALRRAQAEGGGSLTLRGLRPEFGQLVELIEPSPRAHAEELPPRESFVEGVGRATLKLLDDLRELVAFIGELTLALGAAVRHPGRLRLGDVLEIAERAGVGAIPIVVLIGFLLGLILSFQSAIPMRRFGAQVFVADLLGISLIRELGPLMAAIMLTARSGSAFAAEIGTMKINEEVDALTTMGLEPVRFLVVPRALAAFLVVPVLTMLMNLAGLLGGAVVFLSLGYPLVSYVNRITAIVSVGDLMGGLFKGFVFGMVVAAVGCLRGMQTGTGAGAVGESTTSSVVSGIILIALIDGLFAVIFYVVGW